MTKVMKYKLNNFWKPFMKKWYFKKSQAIMFKNDK